MHVYVCVTCACLVPEEVRRGHEIPGTVVIGGCEPPCGPLQEQQVLFVAESALQASHQYFLAGSLLSQPEGCQERWLSSGPGVHCPMCNRH